MVAHSAQTRSHNTHTHTYTLDTNIIGPFFPYCLLYDMMVLLIELKNATEATLD